MRKNRWITIVAGLMICGSLQVSPATAQPADLHLDEAQEAAALQLAIDWGVDVEQAKGQIAIQRQQNDLASAVRSALPDSYAGSYIDHRANQLVVRSTDLPSLEKWLSTSGSPLAVRTEVGNFSIKFIEEDLYSQVKSALSSQKVPMQSAAVLQDTGQLEVRVDTDNASSAQLALKGLPNVTVRGVALNAAACNSTVGNGTLTCTSPYRGGIFMDYQLGWCSSGFMVHSIADNSPYIMGAGHCLTSGDTVAKYGKRLSDNRQILLGYSHRSIYNLGAGQDYGIVHLTNTASWGNGTNGTLLVLPGTYVVNGSTYTTTRAENYPISSAAQPYEAQNGYVCKTGVTSGTTCGYFVANEINTNFTDWKMTACHGDSGGPMYIAGQGYGLFSQLVNENASGCVTNQQTQYAVMTRLPAALEDLHVALN